MVNRNPKAREIGRYVNDYDSALVFLGKKRSRTLANDTVVHWEGEGPIHVRLHRTNIVTYLPSGAIILDSGGYHTRTTKQRIGELLPPGVSIFTRKGDWLVQQSRNGVITTRSFEDKMILTTQLPEYTRQRAAGLSSQMTRPDHPGHMPNPGDRLTEREVSATRNHAGAWEVAAIVNGHREHSTYYGYSKREAIRRFVAEMNARQTNPGKRVVHRVGDVKVYWSSELQEYEVRREGQKEGYFTTDKQDALDTASTMAHEKNPSRPPVAGLAHHSGKFSDTVESMLYHIDHDQEIGSVDELGWYGLVSGLLYRDAEEYVASVVGDIHPRDFAHDADGYDWPLNAIIGEDSQGFIDVTTFKDNRDAIREWREIEKEYEKYYGGDDTLDARD